MSIDRRGFDGKRMSGIRQGWDLYKHLKKTNTAYAEPEYKKRIMDAVKASIIHEERMKLMLEKLRKYFNKPDAEYYEFYRYTRSGFSDGAIYTMPKKDLERIRKEVYEEVDKKLDFY